MYIKRYVSREELFRYYSMAKALIHPAVKDPIGFVVIEALSTQTPVIASVNTGASDLLPKEWVLENFKVKDWIQKIKEILNNDPSIVAEKVFNKEHLNLYDPFFVKIAEKIKNKIYAENIKA